MFKFSIVLSIIIFFISCSLTKNNSLPENYSIRYIGNKHLIYSDGIVMTRGIYVTNDDNLDEKVKVKSYKFKVFRDNNLLKEHKNEGEYYSESIKNFLANDLEYLDSLRFENVIIEKYNNKNVGSIIYVHKIDRAQYD